MGAERCRRMHVGLSLGACCRDAGPFDVAGSSHTPQQSRFGSRYAACPVAAAEHNDARMFDTVSVEFDACGDAHYCKIARPSRKFFEAKSLVSSSDRNPDFRQKLVGFKRSFEHALDEVPRSNEAFTPLTPFE
jgi:hypothetical protein